MANTANNQGIANSWSLIAFAKLNGRPKLADFVNGETGEAFKSVAFVDGADNVNCLVGFSQNLGELSVPEIIRRKDELRVVQLNSGTYKLCKKGESSWQDIDLGI